MGIGRMSDDHAREQAREAVITAAIQFVSDTRWSMQSIRLRDAVAALAALDAVEHGE
jgi:hypothetical protein